MAINTLVTIQDTLTAWAVGHSQLQGRIVFEADDHRSAYITEESEFPIMFVAPIDVVLGRAMNTHTLRVYIYERINDDRKDVWENANDTSLLLRDIRVWWNDYGNDDITIVEDPIGQFGCDKELDNLVGYFADIKFEIPSHGRCDVPVNVTPNPTPSCEPATQIITDSDGNELYSNSIPSGATETQVIEDSTAVLKDTLGTTISTTSILAEGSEDIIAPNSTYLVEYVNGTDIQSGSIVSGGSVTVQVPNPVTCADATVGVNGTLFDTVPSGDTLDIQVRQEQGSTQVGSKQGQYWRVDDSPVNINGGLIANVPAEDALSINVTLNGTNSGTWNSGTQTWEVVSACADTTIEVNGTTEGTFNAGSTVDVQLSDSGGVVTPDSVTIVGNDVQIVLPTSGTPIDTDAQAFLTATGIVDATQINAVNTFVTLAKAQGIWNDLDKIYPFVGGTATTHRYNLKNALMDGTFFGGVTHNVNGVTFNGTTGYFDTGWATNAGNVHNRHFSQYIKSQTTNGGWAGSFDGTNVFGMRLNNSTGNTLCNGLSFMGFNNLESISPVLSIIPSSVNCVSIDSSTQGKFYSNGLLIRSNVVSIGSTPTTGTVYCGALNQGLPTFFNGYNLMFSTVGAKLDASKQLVLNNLVRQFNATIGR